MSLLDLASLVLSPTATKEGKVYSAIPDTGKGDMTFSRGSAATRVNSEGLIEKERANFVLHSNDFSQSNWVKLGAGSGSAAIVTSGFSDPDGGSNAWRLQCDLNGGTTSNDQSLIYQGGSLTGVFAFSYYVKSNTGSSQDFAFGNGLANYENGTATTEWQRFTAFFNCPSNNNTFIGARGSLATDDTLDILIYAAQLEQGLVAQPYIETTTTAVYEGITDDVPRVDYSGGGCPSLLLEGSRTNKLPQSEYFEDSGFSSGNITFEGGYLAPDGTNSAYKITATTKSSAYLVYATIFDANDARSIFARTVSGTGTTQLLSHNSNTNNIFTITEEWQRFEVTSTPATSQNFYPVDFRGSSTTLTEVIIWGGQAEGSASYVSSYIPSYGTSTTRVADSLTSETLSLSLGYSLLIEMETLSTSDYNQIQFRQDTPSIAYILRIGNQINVGGSSYVATNTIGQNKFALGVDTDGSFALYKNGTSVSTGSGISADLQKVRTDSSGQRIKQIVLFPTRLTNDQLEELTK